MENRESSLFLLISGPAGSGKTTLIEGILRHYHSLQRIVTATSRLPRPNEKDRKDYYFFPEEKFKRLIEMDAFFEWARVHGNYYGCLKDEVLTKLKGNRDLILSVDPQGARTFQKSALQYSVLRERLVSIFVMPDCLETVRKRLLQRGNDSLEEINQRLETAKWEIDQWKYYDYCLMSRDGQGEELDLQWLKSIFCAEKIRNRQKISLENNGLCQK
jgi:guanylate kinase